MLRPFVALVPRVRAAARSAVARPRTAIRERGQMLIVFAMVIVPITFALGAIVVDASLWQSERRGAQKDADLSALAGAYELLAPEHTTSTEDDARQAAADYAEMNDESGDAVTPDKNATDVSLASVIVVDNSCFDPVDPTLDSVVVNIDHNSRTFFSSIFGVDFAPDIGAHARACMGSPIDAEGLFPLGVQVTSEEPDDSDCFQPDPDDPTGPEIPIFGQFCQLGFAADDTVSGEGGFLNLYNDGSFDCSGNNAGGNNVLIDEIASGGSNTTCYVAPAGTTSDDCDDAPPEWWPFDEVNYCVYPATGTFSNPRQEAFTDLLESEGECDSEFGTDSNTYDDFLEVVQATNGDPNPPPGTTTFARRDCDSPRLVDLVILEQFDPGGNAPRPILAFASFFLYSCQKPDGTEFRTCDVTGGQIGQTKLYGFFINVLQTGSIGQLSKYGQRHISLAE